MQLWLRQRNMHGAEDTLNGFLMTMLVVHLCELKKIGRYMNALQVLRGTLDFIGALAPSVSLSLRPCSNCCPP